METKTHWKKNYNYDYLGAYSLADMGEDVILTIKQTKKEKVIGSSGKKEDCFVVYFVESDKPMILNRTNAKTIEKVYKTPFVEEWIGKRVQLYSAKVNAFGETTDALRIRDFMPVDKTLDVTAAKEKLRKATTMAELQQAYMALSAAEKSNKEVIELKDELKKHLL